VITAEAITNKLKPVTKLYKKVTEKKKPKRRNLRKLKKKRSQIVIKNKQAMKK
jgi:hypothetical protein